MAQLTQLSTILTLGYLVVCFLITNFLSKKTVTTYYNKWWMKRRYIIPIGMVPCMIIIFTVAYLVPDNMFLIVAAPFICYYVGLIANLSFQRVAGYTKLAETKSPYNSSKRKK